MSCKKSRVLLFIDRMKKKRVDREEEEEKNLSISIYIYIYFLLRHCALVDSVLAAVGEGESEKESQ